MASPSTTTELPFPKSVWFIIVNEFCERFSYYGMRALLSLYLRNSLQFSEKNAKIIYHTFNMLAYFFPIFGAIISDSLLGKFRTIFYISMIYATGNTLLAFSSSDAIGLPRIPFSLTGLFLIAVGTGGIKPCVSSFGGDQFILPQQQLQLSTYFSLFYLSINVGSLSSTVLTPVLRKVYCLGEKSCYPLAFGIPGVLMIVAIVIFLLGRPFYKMLKPETNVIVQVAKCIGYAIKQKIKSHDQVEHWLDRSEPKYGASLVTDIKVLLKVLVLFIPLPIFWALFDQQGSGWTFQATRMDGYIGFYTILPEQMQVTNPLLIVLFIPVFTYGVYPALTKFNLLKRPLQRMVFGGFITAISFIVSAFLAFALEATEPVLPGAGECQLRMYNFFDCDSVLTLNGTDIKLKAMGYEKIDLKVEGELKLNYILRSCNDSGLNGSDFTVKEKTAMLYYFTADGLKILEDDIEKNVRGLPHIRTLVDRDFDVELVYYDTATGAAELTISSQNNSIFPIDPGTFTVNHFDKELNFYLGGVYTVLVSVNLLGHIKKVEYFEITQPNSVHMLWLIPQYIIITISEIMLNITGLEFSYSQAPLSMKSVVTALYLLNTALGNLLIVIIESARIFEKQSYDFLLYSALMILDMVLFAFVAMRYKTRYVASATEEAEANPK